LLTGTGDIDVIQGPLFTTDMITYDIERAPFNQLAVRQAMSLAINRQDIIDTVYLGTGTLGNPGWTHPASVYYNSAIAAEYDPAAAAALLDAKPASPTPTATASANWRANRCRLNS
jgi:peptide/nickel transport system substrate-binding protein